METQSHFLPLNGSILISFHSRKWFHKNVPQWTSHRIVYFSLYTITNYRNGIKGYLVLCFWYAFIRNWHQLQCVNKGLYKENPMGFGFFELNIPIGKRVGGRLWCNCLYGSDGEGVRVLLFAYYEFNMPIFRSGMQVYYFTL